MRQKNPTFTRGTRVSLIAQELEWQRSHWLFYTYTQMLLDSRFSTATAQAVLAEAASGSAKWVYEPVRMEGFSFREPEPTDVFQLAHDQVAAMKPEDVRLLASVKPRGDKAHREIHGAFIWAAQQRIRQDDSRCLEYARSV